MTEVDSHRRGQRKWYGPLTAAVFLLSTVGLLVDTATAATPLEDAEEVTRLCDLGAPEIDGGSTEQAKYHKSRRAAVHQTYETTLSLLDEELLRYDRVSGMLTISGFRQYPIVGGALSIRFRNECILSFAMDEQEALDVQAQMAMGTAELRVGFVLISNEEYEADFCPDEEGEEVLHVDLLYARIVDLESGDDEETPGVVARYQTSLGHRQALRRSVLAVDAARQQLPEIQVSHLQWRARGKNWEDGVDEEVDGDELEELTERLAPKVERLLYPCYIRALAKNASLQGALVLEVPYGAQGVGEAKFLMDTLGDTGLQSCVQSRLDSLEKFEISEQVVRGVDAFKATILMRRR